MKVKVQMKGSKPTIIEVKNRMELHQLRNGILEGARIKVLQDNEPSYVGRNHEKNRFTSIICGVE